MHIPAAKALGLAAAVLASSGVAFVVTSGSASAACDAGAYQITAPVAGAVVSGSVPLAATRVTAGSTAAGAADFKVDDTVVPATATDSGYTATWDASNATTGSHTVVMVYSSAQSGGCAAGEAASAPVTFSVGTAAPVPTVDLKTLDTGSLGTATATSTSPTGKTLATTITGTGTATIGWYDSAPASAPAGSTGEYFDIKVPSGSSLTEITLVVDAPDGANSAFFLDPKTNKWAPVIGGTVSGGKLTVTITNSTVPSIADLTGTAFTATALASGDITAACNTAGGTSFTDMTKDVHSASATCLAAYGIAKGLTATTFGPTVKVNREQVAEFLARLLSQAGVTLPATPSAPFRDIPATDPHGKAVNQLAQLGIIKGLTATTFGPTGAVTRAQMASLLVRAYEKAAAMTVTAGTVTFTDVPGTDVHAADIGKLVALGVTQGATATTFAPGKVVLRDQMATFVARTLDLLVVDGKVALKR